MTNRLPRLSYHQQRRLAVASRLRLALRRWGLWVAFTLLLFSAGSNAPLAITASALAGCVAPMWWAWADGPSAAAAALSLAYAVLAWGWLQATRPLIWSSRWRELELQLPLSPNDVKRSDGVWLGLLLSPLGVACAMGWWVMMGHAGLRVTTQALGSAMSLAWALGLAWQLGRWGLSRSRRPRRIMSTAMKAGPTQRGGMAPLWKVLLWWPWRRGRLPRSQRLLLGMPLAVLTALAWMLAGGQWPSLSMAWGGTALMGLGPLSAARLDDETRPLRAALVHLPVPALQAERLLRWLVMLPVLAGVLTLGTALALSQPGVWRGVPLCGWATLVVLGVALDLCWRPRDPGHHSMRWWLLLVMMLAFASEVMP